MKQQLCFMIQVVVHTEQNSPSFSCSYDMLATSAADIGFWHLKHRRMRCIFSSEKSNPMFILSVTLFGLSG